jgi:hypothetical protein
MPHAEGAVRPYPARARQRRTAERRPPAASVPAGLPNDFLAALKNQATVSLDNRHNGVKGPRVAFTTDSFVVRPLFFPGGDFGQLAVHPLSNSQCAFFVSASPLRGSLFRESANWWMWAASTILPPVIVVNR